jgi:hypothetical protein
MKQARNVNNRVTPSRCYCTLPFIYSLAPYNMLMLGVVEETEWQTREILNEHTRWMMMMMVVVEEQVKSVFSSHSLSQ